MVRSFFCIFLLIFTTSFQVSCIERGKSQIQHKPIAEKFELQNIDLVKPNTEDSNLKAKLRALDSHIGDEAFEVKWSEARKEGTLKFFRSFVSYYYEIILESNKAKNAFGPEGQCFGDAHVENFGFEGFATKNSAQSQVNAEAAYVFNDFDDVRTCPLALDVLRYITSVRLYEAQRSDLSNSQIEKLVAELADKYSDILKGKDNVAVFNSKLLNEFDFDVEKKRNKLLKKYVLNKQFIKSDKYQLLEPQNKKNILLQFKDLKEFANFNIFDVAETTSETGGSGGLLRYWLLVEHKSIQHILELKPLVQNRKAGELLELANMFWKNKEPLFFSQIFLQNKWWQLRSKAKETLTLDEWKRDVREEIYKVQIGIIAEQHLEQFLNLHESSNLENWLVFNSNLLALHYLQL